MIFYLDASAVVAPLRSRVTAADFMEDRQNCKKIALFSAIFLFFIVKIVEKRIIL